MTGHASPPRYLPRNHDSWAPAAVLCLDSETRTVTVGASELEVLRCWAARFTRRRHRRRAGEVSTAHGTGSADVAAFVNDCACEDKSAWLFAHNVAFDLCTTRLPAELAALGWELSSRHAVTGSSPWIVLHKGQQLERPRKPGGQGKAEQNRVKWQHTLTIVDSFSILPVPLVTLAQASGLEKPQLPTQDAPLAQWLERCSADVDILSWAVLTLMDWWEASNLGKWSVSGAACAWNAYRHTLADREVIVDPQGQAVEAEHMTCYGGRRDVFRCGQLSPGRYAELDFANAYVTIAATQPLPRKRMGRLTPDLATAILERRSNYGMLARATVKTDVPRWPVRARGRVFYPVGQFTTWLAGPDLADAYDRGALVDVGVGWFYSMSSHMQTWAKMVLGISTDKTGRHPAPAGIWAKSASRSGCGKWAQRGWSVAEYPGPPGDDWTYDDVFVAGTTAAASVCGLAGKYWLSVADQPGSHEFPAVLAWIESHVRVRLGAVLDQVPSGVVIQCDTDGFMASVTEIERACADGVLPDVMAFGRADMLGLLGEYLSAFAAPLTLRPKREFRQAVVYGPQHVVIDGQPRFSGVPATATPSGDGRWSARLWPGLAWQIQQGAPQGYTRPVQDYLIVGPYAHGWITTSGAVRPVEAADAAGGTAELCRWAETRWAACGDQLATAQGAWAEGLWR